MSPSENLLEVNIISGAEKPRYVPSLILTEFGKYITKHRPRIQHSVFSLKLISSELEIQDGGEGV